MADMKADELLEQVKRDGTQRAGQTISSEHLARQNETAIKQSQLEAAAFAEKIIEWLNEQFLALDFDVQQRVFSVALATINLREHLPEEKGGKRAFDNIAYAAKQYYDENK